MAKSIGNMKIIQKKPRFSKIKLNFGKIYPITISRPAFYTIKALTPNWGGTHERRAR